MYHYGTNMHPLDTKVYLLKRYSPVTAFVPFFSERVMLISCSVIISYINALNAQLIISVLIINVENIFFLLLHHIIIKKKLLLYQCLNCRLIFLCTFFRIL